MNAHVRNEDDFSECPEGAMDYIADMLGTGFRDKMIATMGGTAIQIPAGKADLPDDHQLVRCLGRIDAEELVEVIPREKIYIPNGHPKAECNLIGVRRMVLAGRSSNEIARIMNISERQVRRIRAKSGLAGPHLADRLDVRLKDLPDRLRAINTTPALPAQ